MSVNRFEKISSQRIFIRKRFKNIEEIKSELPLNKLSFETNRIDLWKRKIYTSRPIKSRPSLSFCQEAYVVHNDWQET